MGSGLKCQCYSLKSRWLAPQESTSMEAHIKELLRRDGVKLWLPPYTIELRPGCYPSEMLSKYGNETGHSPAEVEQCLEKIRLQAVARLEANKRFADTGVATLYVSKIDTSSESAAGASASDRDANTASDAKTHAPIQCQLSILGQDLRALIAEAFSIPQDGFRLIGNARVIEDNRLLESQGVEHGSDILCILMSEQEKQSQLEQQWRTAADRTREAVKRLTKNRDTAERSYLQITDQHGNPITLPNEESEALALAMALHEKGRKALKKKQYGQALLYLLEADKEFELCRSDILQLVDNYAILNLDVVWCYLRLQSVNSLPDAERRLHLADEGFRRSYGKNFERLTKLRQGVVLEKALIIRLRLLQGSLAYYQRKYRPAHEYFALVAREIKALEVDDNKLSQVMAMGYSAEESRLGLRASGGSIEGAVHRIIEERESEERREEEEQRRYHERQVQKRFGKTPSGKWIDVDTYEKIVDMGFRKRAAGEALRQADNDMNAALEILRVLPRVQSPADDVVDTIEDALFDRTKRYSAEELTGLISSLGFPVEAVTEALHLHPRDIAGAIEALLSSGVPGPLQDLINSNPDFRDAIMRVAHELQEHQNRRYRRRSRNRDRDQGGSREDEVDEDHAAFMQLEGDMSHSPHEHLDTTFEEELQVLEMLQPLVITHLK